MQVEALQECFASAAIRRPGDVFEYNLAPDGVLPDFLKVIDAKASPAAHESDIYAALSDDKIRRRLEDCFVKVPPMADRQRLVELLAEVEGKEVPQPAKAKPKKGEKR